MRLRKAASPASRFRSLTKARIARMLISTARSLLRTEDNMATPCSVKANGNLRRPPHLDVTDCDFKLENSEAVNSNMKSAGKRLGAILSRALIVFLPEVRPNCDRKRLLETRREFG